MYVKLSGATPRNPRADSDEETGMNEPKYLLLHREIWSAAPGSSDELQKKQVWRLRLELAE